MASHRDEWSRMIEARFLRFVRRNREIIVRLGDPFHTGRNKKRLDYNVYDFAAGRHCFSGRTTAGARLVKRLGAKTSSSKEGPRIYARQKTPFCRETVGQRKRFYRTFIVAAGEQVLTAG